MIDEERIKKYSEICHDITLLLIRNKLNTVEEFGILDNVKDFLARIHAKSSEKDFNLLFEKISKND
jgi:hypothetical protein